MTCTEFWLTYQFASRAHLPPTTQLIELDVNGVRLCDLEDVLDHVFRQGYVEAKYRPVSWWERKDGVAVKVSQLIEDLVKVGVGKTPEGALKLVVDDLPTALWFSYVYVHAPASHRVVTQRIKIHELPPKACDRLAHVTNHIFAMGWLPAKLRTVVHWQKSCGFKLEETACVKDLLIAGDGVEGRCLKLVIGKDFDLRRDTFH
ncbi:hypothetical protein BJ165DRAFT_1337235 [Panaeolus papilionaceus]|nr:hypothetical protein BJ165DRAFT_1337235 [Panaeolus papilionaceus]